MGKLSFSELAKILQPYVNNNSSQPSTAEEIIKQIVNDNSQDLIEYNENTFKNYFSGRSKITRLAKRINGHLNQGKFDSYLSALDNDALNTISKELRKCGVKAIPSKVATICAKELIKIIDDAAKSTKVGKTVKVKLDQGVEDAINKSDDFQNVSINTKNMLNNSTQKQDIEVSLSNKIEQRFNQLYDGKSLVNKCFSLLIIGALDEPFENQGILTIPSNRKFEYTDKHMAAEFKSKPLKIKAMPLLVCNEKQSNPSYVYCCEITNFSDSSNGDTYIYYKLMGKIPYKLFDENYVIFGVLNKQRGYWGENNRTHLAIKGNNLLQVLRDLGY
ncbi:hypothetical protein M5361_02935 [Ligilactobacillus agilis]|nr:hypothetical protein [Ligilactobacillus agilis]